MHHSLPCPHCQAVIPVEPTQAGQAVHCSSCGESSKAPSLREIRALPEVETKAAPAKKTPEHWSSAQGTAFVGGVIATLISAVAITLLVWYMVGLNVTAPDFESSRLAEDKVIDGLGVMETLETWEMLKKAGMPQEDAPWIVNQRIAKQITVTCYAFGVIGVMGLLAIIFSLVSGSKKRTS